MGKKVSRRRFLTASFSSADCQHEDSSCVSGLSNDGGIDLEFSHEIPNGLLRMEAERLGLDVEKDNAEVLKHLRVALEGFKDFS